MNSIVAAPAIMDCISSASETSVLSAFLFMVVTPCVSLGFLQIAFHSIAPRSFESRKRNLHWFGIGLSLEWSSAHLSSVGLVAPCFCKEC